MKALDAGTMFLVKAEIDQLVDQPIFTRERNCFLQAATTDDTESTLKENNWSYAKYEDQFYIFGEDAIKLKNLLTLNLKNMDDKDIVVTEVGELRRPMKDGLLNTGEEKLSIAMIQTIIKNLLGKPKFKGEPLCFSVPGDPVDKNMKVLFHETMLKNFFTGLGYTVESIPEALAIIYSERPVVEDKTEESGESPYSGIAISFGSGMANICYAYKKMPLINFAISNCGDWIDKETAKVAGVDVSNVTRYKEGRFNLTKVDYSNMIEAGLDIYYQNMIEYGLKIFGEKFEGLTDPIQAPIEIVVAGGTASVPGFIEKFRQIIGEKEYPFKIKEVKLAKNPLYSVAHGCLAKAIATENKMNKSKGEKDKSKESSSGQKK